ncbi:organic radical activating enzyme [Elusimicrobium simillimum]|uniref:7-carboxy-7-deazaguanine synthase QueE n=1 Tax=Elusimicrobium simillimum TaxID=3143438 RepID=UPI003C6F9282
MPAQSYKLNEIFYSIQGEGAHTGAPAVFVRLSGCSMGCDFCDTDFSHKLTMTAPEVLHEAAKYPVKRVIFTGGEPGEQNIAALAKFFKEQGYETHIETNGSVYFDTSSLDHVTLSPKAAIDERMLNAAHVIKIVVGAGTKIKDLEKYFKYQSAGRQIYLQPESNKQENIDLCVKIIKANPFLRLSLQTHKFANLQ